MATLVSQTKQWVKSHGKNGQAGLSLIVDLVKAMGEKDHDWDAAARFLKEVETLPRGKQYQGYLKLAVRAYFGDNALRLVKDPTHYSGFRFEMRKGKWPTAAIMPRNHFQFLENAVANGANIDDANVWRSLTNELKGTGTTDRPYDPEAAARRLATKLWEEEVPIEKFISILREELKKRREDEVQLVQETRTTKPNKVQNLDDLKEQKETAGQEAEAPGKTGTEG